MGKENLPLFVAFSTQKGGVGKSLLTVLIAGYLHHQKSNNVAIIDCDFPQHSIQKMREREVEHIQKDDYYKLMAYNLFQSGKKAYPVKTCKAEDGIDAAYELINESEKKFDIIFFDLPGTINSKGITKTITQMDYIFAPIIADRLVLESTLDYVITVRDNLITTGQSDIYDLRLIWNRVDRREKTELYKVYDGAINELGLKTLNTVLPNSTRFNREYNEDHRPIGRSTIFPTDKNLISEGNIADLANEICSIINLDKHE